jgi:hypothetical protein
MTPEKIKQILDYLKDQKEYMRLLKLRKTARRIAQQFREGVRREPRVKWEY